jgi:plasmid stabilization system protein ParE
MPAAEVLERICEWIEQDNPEAARRVARTIYDECDRLTNFPNLGRASRRMAGRFELTFAPLPYIVVYQVISRMRLKSRVYFMGPKIGFESAFPSLRSKLRKAVGRGTVWV